MTSHPRFSIERSEKQPAGFPVPLTDFSRMWLDRKWSPRLLRKRVRVNCLFVSICVSTDPPKVLPVSVFGHAVRRVDLAHQGAEASSFGDVLPAAHAEHLRKHTRDACEHDVCRDLHTVSLKRASKNTQKDSSDNLRGEILQAESVRNYQTTVCVCETTVFVSTLIRCSPPHQN